MKKLLQTPLKIVDGKFNLPLNNENASCVRGHKPNANPAKNGSMSEPLTATEKVEIQSKSFGDNYRVGLESRGTKVNGTAKETPNNQTEDFRPESKIKKGGLGNSKHEVESSSCQLRTKGTEHESEETRIKKMASQHKAVPSLKPGRDFAESNISLSSIDKNGDDRMADILEKQRGTTAIKSELETLRYRGDGELEGREMQSEISMKSRQRCKSEESAATLGEVSERIENHGRVNGTQVEVSGNDEIYHGSNEMDSQLETRRRRCRVNFNIFPALSELDETETKKDASHLSSKGISLSSDDFRFRNRGSNERLPQEQRQAGEVQGKAKSCLAGKEDKFEKNLEKLRITQGNGLKVSGALADGNKCLYKESTNGTEQKNHMLGRQERRASLKQSTLMERNKTKEELLTSDNSDVKRRFKNQKNEKIEPLGKSCPKKEERCFDETRKGEDRREKIRPSSKVRHRQSKSMDKASGKITENFQNVRSKAIGETNWNTEKRFEKNTDLANTKSEDEVGIRNRSSFGENLIMRNGRRVSRISQTPIRIHTSQLAFDFSYGMRSRLNIKGSRKLSIMSLPTDQRSMTPQAKRLYLENVIAFRYSERPFGCLACTNCSYRSQTLEEQASHHRHKHISELPYFCRACNKSGIKLPFRTKEELEKHILNSEHSTND